MCRNRNDISTLWTWRIEAPQRAMVANTLQGKYGIELSRYHEEFDGHLSHPASEAQSWAPREDVMMNPVILSSMMVRNIAGANT
jgi:hypothetical protein